MAITLTERAAQEIKVVFEQQAEERRKAGQEPEPLYLRAGIRGGGCSGFSYLLDLTEELE